MSVNEDANQSAQAGANPAADDRYWTVSHEPGRRLWEGDLVAGAVPPWLCGRLRLLHAGGLIVALRLRRVNERDWLDEDALARMSPDYADATDADLLHAVVEATNFIAGNIHDDCFLGKHWGMFAKRVSPKHRYGNLSHDNCRDGLVVDVGMLSDAIYESVRQFEHFLGVHHTFWPGPAASRNAVFRFIFFPNEWWADLVRCYLPGRAGSGEVKR
jgi:hypothetical protein